MSAYLFYETGTGTDTRAKVFLVYYTEPPAELKNTGNYIKVDNFQDPEPQPGKNAVLYCNPQTKAYWYEYVDRPPTMEEELQQTKERLVQAENDVIVALEAATELYEMLMAMQEGGVN